MLAVICIVIITERSVLNGIRSGSKSIYKKSRESAQRHHEVRTVRHKEYRSEKELRDRERAVRREEKREERREALREREEALEERKKRRSEMKVSGVMLNTKLVDESRSLEAETDRELLAYAQSETAAALSEEVPEEAVRAITEGGAAFSEDFHELSVEELRNIEDIRDIKRAEAKRSFSGKAEELDAVNFKNSHHINLGHDFRTAAVVMGETPARMQEDKIVPIRREPFKEDFDHTEFRGISDATPVFDREEARGTSDPFGTVSESTGNRPESDIDIFKLLDDMSAEGEEKPEERPFTEIEREAGPGLFGDEAGHFVSKDPEEIDINEAGLEEEPEIKGTAFETKEETSAIKETAFQDIVEPNKENIRAELKKEDRGAGEQTAKAPEKIPYVKPSVELLDMPKSDRRGDSMDELRRTASKLKETLATFGVNVTMTEISQGPTVTRFEMQPESGVKVSKILSLSDDIKLNMAATDVRIEAPIPGKAAIGIEIPNKEPIPVSFRELVADDAFKNASSNVTFAVGKDIEGRVIVSDIAKMPHLLIAGATGSGKSVCINTLIMSILFKADPQDVKLIMIDPKVVELSVYNGIPHLMIPVVTDPKKASAALQWGVAEMDDRYNKFAEYKVRDMKGYNKLVTSPDFRDIPENERPAKMPQIVIIVDELADLMMVASKEVEESICRIAQKARAAGIHLVVATQRPSVDVITGLIKANMPSRIAFSVSSGTDSRTILDMVGAEKLLGKGDMLFYPQGYSKPARLQGAFVSDDEVTRIVDALKAQTEGESYDDGVISRVNAAASDSGGAGLPGLASGNDNNGKDELFEKAARFIIDKDKASIGMLQRAFKIGFNRAARIMDQLAEAGVVGEEEGTKPRKILMSEEQFDQYVEECL
ncbi:MAG: DNA translocase FtsK [Lachnospiraceae bacterium]|nr:DNA translocase FtsK [Lachnospiraceae bacterium]